MFQSIELDYIPSKDGFVDREQVTIKSLGEWLRNEIFISSVNMMSAKEQMDACQVDSQEYKFSHEEFITSKAEMDAYNHLLLEIGYSYHKGISNGT
jgi:hypothetical protein